MPYAGLSLEEWTALLASREPVPAGGALSLVTLASVAALAAKIVRLRGLDPLLFETAAPLFLQRADEDADAYRKATRERGGAEENCMEVGFGHLEAALRFLEALSDRFSGFPPTLAADLAACGRLARASADTLLLNLAVNLSAWTDRLERGDEMARRLDALRSRLERT